MTADSSLEDPSSWDANVLPPPRAGASDDLVLLTTESMRARGRPLAIGALWGVQTCIAALVALPAAAAVASVYGGHPSGDAPLWQPGGLPLLDLLADPHGAARETLTLAALLFLVAGFADLLPLGALLTSVGYATRDRRPPSMGSAFARSSALFPTLATLFAMASLAEGALAGIAVFVSARLAGATLGKLGEARADQTGWLAAFAILTLTAFVGVLHDLARAGVIRFRVRALRAWTFALNAFRRAPAAVLWSWAWRALAGWVPVATAAILATRYGGRGGGPLVALFVAHQLVLVARVAFRASWLAAALRAVDGAHRVVPGKRRG